MSTLRYDCPAADESRFLDMIKLDEQLIAVPESGETPDVTSYDKAVASGGLAVASEARVVEG